MKTIKTMLMTATALGMLAGVAVAGENEAEEIQNGNDNKAYIYQTDANDSAALLKQVGDDNLIRVDQGGSENAVGSSTDSATQRGDDNVLVVDQNDTFTGRNRVGAGLESINGGFSASSGTGFDQVGNNNLARIHQNNNRNVVGEVLQHSRRGNRNPANRLTINQGTASNSYGYNIVNSVEQRRTGNGPANIMTIDQVTSLNRVEGATQIGQDNRTTIEQDGGNYNRIKSTMQNGDGNLLLVRMTGTANGTLNNATNNHATLASFTGLKALAIGIEAGTFVQDGDDNVARILIDGDTNLVASLQRGDRHDLRIDIEGSSNEVASAQYGHDQFARIDIDGSDNDVGVEQRGSTNIARVTIMTNGNHASIMQNGHGNLGVIEQ